MRINVFAENAQDALQRLVETKQEHQADVYETHFRVFGENYRIRIERIPKEKSDGKQQ